jgi:hypothetical protein
MRRMKIGHNDEDDGKGMKKSGGQGRQEGKEKLINKK